MNYNSNDPLKDDWYRPNTWYIQSKAIHSSRLITLIGREVPDLLKPTYSFGGLSLSQMAKPYVDNWLKTRQRRDNLVKYIVRERYPPSRKEMRRARKDSKLPSVNVLPSYGRPIGILSAASKKAERAVHFHHFIWRHVESKDRSDTLIHKLVRCDVCHESVVTSVAIEIAKKIHTAPPAIAHFRNLRVRLAYSLLWGAYGTLNSNI
jgi:Anti-CBASS protein Acb1-like